jgi:MoxR-like ATPase
MQVKTKITNLLNALNKGVYERDEELRLALLSSIAGESIFLLGPPGVAKSLVARKLKFAYKDAKVFEYLMSRFSTPDEIFGPVSISKLTNEDKSVRIVDKYLPTADVVFLDEIWKAGPSIQNALLTVINEKVYRNGDTEINVPMKALISASNELPAQGQGLEALWDRFLVRLVVSGIENDDGFFRMITEESDAYEDSVDENDKITAKEYECWGKEIGRVAVPENALNVIGRVRHYIAAYNEKEENRKTPIYVSDRRWRKIVRLLRTSAFLNDRSEVDFTDCFLIAHCLWNEYGQIEIAGNFVRDAVEKCGCPISFDIRGIKKELKDFQAEIDGKTKCAKDTRKQSLVRIRADSGVKGDYYEIVNPPGTDYIGMIRKEDYDSLSENDKSVKLYHYNYQWDLVEKFGKDMRKARKGGSKTTIFIDNVEYSLKHKANGEFRQTIRKPDPSLEKEWDSRIDSYLSRTEKMKARAEGYRRKGSRYQGANAFVSPDLAEGIVIDVADILKKIGMAEVEIRGVQSKYKNLKNEEIVEKEDGNAGDAIRSDRYSDDTYGKGEKVINNFYKWMGLYER